MVDNTATKVIYEGDGETTKFPFTFEFADASDVCVLIYDEVTDTETVLSKDYYVDATAKVVHYPGYASGQEPAEADQPAKLAAGQRLVVYRNTPLTQLTDLGDKYPLPVIEAMPDKLTYIVQELQEQLDRCIKNSISGAQNFLAYMQAIAENARTAWEKATAASESATKAQEQAEEATREAIAAKTSADAAENWNIAATKNAEAAENAAATVTAYQAPEWKESTTYKVGDFVTYTDGSIYKAIKENKDTLPTDTTCWTKVVLYMGDNFFLIDSAGYIVPAATPTYSGFWTLDTSGYIVPTRSA